MKQLLFITIAAFATAALLSNSTYTEPKPLTPECYISCFSAETNQMIQADALTPGFAMLHPEPAYFKLDNPVGSTVQFACADGTAASGYLIASSKKKSKKWLFVIQEWWGLNDYIKKEAETFAAELGNVNVLAIDMYDGKVATTRDSATKYMSGAKAERLQAIINAAVAYAGSKASIYTVGWCFGGGWSLQASLLAGSQAKGCIMYYGRPEKDKTKLQNLTCDVIGFFGTKDKGIPETTVDEFEQNMKSLGKNITLHKYEAGHGFANPSNPVFNKEAAEDAHAKAIAFLKERM